MRAAGATVQAYREQMADYAFMKALEVWYDRIDLESMMERLKKEAVSEELRARGEERIEKAQARSVVEHDFPKLVEHHGARPLIKDNPPLIFHPSAEQAPGYRTRYTEAIALYRESLPEHVRVLFDRFHFFDLAVKVVGVGSVGTQCTGRAVYGRGRRPAFPADQGSAGVGT